MNLKLIIGIDKSARRTICIASVNLFTLNRHVVLALRNCITSSIAARVGTHVEATFVCLHNVDTLTHGIVGVLLGFGTPFWGTGSVNTSDATALHLTEVYFVGNSTSSNYGFKMTTSTASLRFLDPHTIVVRNLDTWIVRVGNNFIGGPGLGASVSRLLQTVFLNFKPEEFSAYNCANELSQYEPLHITKLSFKFIIILRAETAFIINRYDFFIAVLIKHSI